MARWITKKGERTILTPSGTYFYCDRCGDWTTYGRTRYCMNCGAHMENAHSYEDGYKSFEEDEKKWK